MIDLLIYKGREELEVRAHDWPAACRPPAASIDWIARLARMPKGTLHAPIRTLPTQPPACSFPACLPQMILMQHKQRHHLVTQYVHNPALDRVQRPSTLSPFLQQFYKSN